MEEKIVKKTDGKFYKVTTEEVADFDVEREIGKVQEEIEKLTIKLKQLQSAKEGK